MTGRIPDPPREYSLAWATQLVRVLEHRQNAITPRYVLSNYAERRSLDAATATTRDIADFVCTLAADLQAAGKIG